MTKQECQEKFEKIFGFKEFKSAYKKAYDKVMDIVQQPNSYEFMLQLTSGYDEDVTPNEYGYMKFYCEIELDRSELHTSADYVSVEFEVAYYVETKFGDIVDASMSVSYPNGDGGRFCWVDPDVANPVLESADWDLVDNNEE